MIDTKLGTEDLRQRSEKARERERDLEKSRLQRQEGLKFLLIRLLIRLIKPIHNLSWYWAKDVVLIQMAKNHGVLYLPNMQKIQNQIILCLTIAF
jgi:hypothetical protein